MADPIAGATAIMNTSQINASQKAQLSQWFELADKTLDETEKLMDLNLRACRETMEQMAHCCLAACDVHDIPSALNWQTAALKPLAERSAEYGARLAGLASGSGLDFGRTFEAQWESLGRQMNGWMVPRTGPTPQGQGEPMDYLRNSMQAFDSVWENMRRNMVQAQQMGLGKPLAPESRNKGAVRKTKS
jgi:phasin family protein